MSKPTSIREAIGEVFGHAPQPRRRTLGPGDELQVALEAHYDRPVDGDEAP